MYLLRKYFSAAVVCLLSFFRRVPRLLRRALCAVCAAAVLFSSTPLTISAAVEESPQLLERSLELTPNESDPDVTITLNGMMPENASAKATDVTADMEEPEGDSAVVVAYDISIDHDGGEFQPAEGQPIFVEINTPAVSDSGNISVIHIADDGTSEQIEHFTVEDGKVSFYATGFSIYEIVDVDSGKTQGDLVKNLAELTEPEGVEFGFNLYYGAENYFTSEVNSNNALVETTNQGQASV